MLLTEYLWKAFKLLLCISLLTWGIHEMRNGAFLTPPFIFLGAAIVLASLITPYTGKPWAKLFFPNEQFEKPQANYGIPEARLAEKRYEEAIQEYQVIAAEYPDEAKPWMGMLEIALIHLKDAERGAALLREGQGALNDADELKRLEQMYKVYSTSTNSAEQERRTIPFGGRKSSEG